MAYENFEFSRGMRVLWTWSGGHETEGNEEYHEAQCAQRRSYMVGLFAERNMAWGVCCSPFIPFEPNYAYLTEHDMLITDGFDNAMFFSKSSF